VLPLLYLHGLSTSDFAPALEQFLGSGQGLSASVITRLTEQWRTDARAFGERSLAEADYVYLWVDGIHLKVRLEQDKVCLLVMIGVRADGRKELVALADGFWESSESWADLLRDCKRRGMRAPVLAVGDGALGFWKALRDVFLDTKEQRCWWHKIGNVLAALPKSAHPGAKKALAEVYNAENKEQASKAAKVFAADYGAKWPKAAENHSRSRCAARVLRPPSRALGAPAHHEPDRVDLRDRAVTAAGHQRPRLPRGGCRHGAQTHRIRPAPLEAGQRTPPGRPRPRRREVRERQTRRTTRRFTR
jgi:transposase-like protein